jgi:hypothetical protein
VQATIRNDGSGNAENGGPATIMGPLAPPYGIDVARHIHLRNIVQVQLLPLPEGLVLYGFGFWLLELFLKGDRIAVATPRSPSLSERNVCILSFLQLLHRIFLS